MKHLYILATALLLMSCSNDDTLALTSTNSEIETPTIVEQLPTEPEQPTEPQEPVGPIIGIIPDWLIGEYESNFYPESMHSVISPYLFDLNFLPFGEDRILIEADYCVIADYGNYVEITRGNEYKVQFWKNSDPTNPDINIKFFKTGEQQKNFGMFSKI